MVRHCVEFGYVLSIRKLLLSKLLINIMVGNSLDKLRCTDTSDVRHFGPKTFRHWCPLEKI